MNNRTGETDHSKSTEIPGFPVPEKLHYESLIQGQVLQMKVKVPD